MRHSLSCDYENMAILLYIDLGASCETTQKVCPVEPIRKINNELPLCRKFLSHSLGAQQGEDNSC